MKSLKRRFNNIVERSPNQSSYICFAEAIKGQSFSKRAIQSWFSKLVQKDDFDKKDKRALLRQLWNLSDGLEDDKKTGLISPLPRLYH